MSIRFFLAFFFISTSVFVAKAQDPWINEIHYDNDGIDVTEGVEIAGPAGLSLNCYDLVFYNGGNGNPYLTVNLSGVIPDESCGVGALWFSIPNIQNGSPDGIALYFDASNTGCFGSDYLVQFISYEGTFTASIASLPAVIAGQTSVNIGVAEGPSSPVGNSLQLNGSGDSYGDFTWSPSDAHTNGQLNTSQTISPCDPPSYSCIWTENFSTQADGTQNDPSSKWTTSAGNCDGDGTPGTVNNNYWGVQGGEFRVNDIEGLTCPCTDGGINDNLFITENIDISSYSEISISISLRAYDEGGGGFECDGLCNSEDKLTAQYEIDGGGWVDFASMCGVDANYSSLECIDVPNGNNLQIRVLVGNQSNDENYYFDNINVCEAECSVVLPIELKQFTGEYNKLTSQNDLVWLTNSERNNAFFIIEKLIESTWQEIGRVNGAGTTNEEQIYSFSDEYPVNGMNYYRLSQVDIDGQKSTYNSLAIQSNLEGFKLHPNPTSENVNFSLDKTLIGKNLLILDNFGRIVHEQDVASNSFELNLKTIGLNSGVYLVRIGNHNKRLVIN